MTDARDTDGHRRPSRKLNTDEEIELRRARGELSCAECKRLKLKCDKKLPCSSCVRRGCPTLCPHGSLTNGHGSRYVLTDTEELHRKISEMGERIRQLEDALALLQSSISPEKHILLQDELLSIKYGAEKRPSVEPEPDDPLAETVDVFGTLTIGGGGESRYFGASAGSETLLSTESQPGNKSIKQAMPELLNSLAAMCPVGSMCPTGPETFESAMTMLFSCLPSRPRAWALCETFLEQGSWLFRPVQRAELIHDIMSPVYAAKEDRENPLCMTLTEISPHKLSILYSIFALGCLVDLTLPVFNEEGERYHHCARAAIALRSIFDSPMVETVQAILFMGYYCGNSAARYSRDSVWMLASLGSKVAQSIGMHRDPARWNMDDTTAERRRTLFWEVYSADMFSSLALGRPPAIALSYVDCALPKPQDESDPDAQFWNWKYQFNKSIFGSVIELTLAAKSPDYKTILEFDRKVREMPLPPALSFLSSGVPDIDVGLSVSMRGGYLSMVRSVTMLYIHKSYFARALFDHPENPLRSPYATSFLAATRCASAMIRTSANHIKRHPELSVRWWALWTHIFSAAMVVGLIVTRAPSCSFAPAAFAELTIAVELFESSAEHSPRVRTGMEILKRLQEKASMLSVLHRGGAEFPTATPHIIKPQDSDADELSIFSGQTRVLINKMLSQKSPGTVSPAAADKSWSPEPPGYPAGSSSTGGQPSEAASQSSGSPDLTWMPDVHPSLMEYLSMFPADAAAPGATANTPLDTTPLDTTPLDTFPGASHSSIATGVPVSQLPVPDFSSFQTPVGLPLDVEQSRTQASTELLGDPTAGDPFQQLYAETLAKGMWAMNDISEQGSAVNSGNGIDEDWVMFMKESGLV